MDISNWYIWTFYLIPALLAVWYWTKHTRENLKNRYAFESALQAGLTAPPVSLHPVIDYSLCLGCGTCVINCPEQSVLGLVNRKPATINPGNCIGHGACKTNCPTNAIKLVFGNEQEGYELPHLTPAFESNVPGIFIAGELGGMGLIRNAFEQGKRAIKNIARVCKTPHQSDLDVVIVGAGPSGFAATLSAQDSGMKYVTIEQYTLGGTIAHYPRGKIVMTAPVDLPLAGPVRIRETTKEYLISLLEDIERKTKIQIHYTEKMLTIKRDETGGFLVTTDKNRYRSKTVLLAIGRRGAPRKLNVPGEDQDKVRYSLIDASEYTSRRVLVVGGGDSAVESAISLAEAGAEVTLSCLTDSFARAKQKNREKLDSCVTNGQVKILYHSQVTAIRPDAVELVQQEKPLTLVNDFVIINIGAELPGHFLSKFGIKTLTKFGEE
jgi:thioredoxin reductase